MKRWATVIGLTIALSTAVLGTLRALWNVYAAYDELRDRIDATGKQVDHLEKWHCKVVKEKGIFDADCP